jgi:hypothetical protein
MNRRTYLNIVGATASTLSLAGCVNGDDDGTTGNGTDATDDGTDTDEGTATDDGNGSDIEFSLTPLSYDDEDQRPIAHSATVAGGGYDSSEGPLGISIELTNQSETNVAYGERRTAQFQAQLSDDKQFALYPGVWNELDGQPYEFDDDCWRRTELYVTTEEYQIGELQPGESDGSSLVMTATATEDCPSTVPEEITFRTEFNVWNPEEDENMDDGVEYEWGFKLGR